ncbi:MAG: zinc-binding dehydrogenase [Actinobacteria bacterium]|nr:zinc-binding dehydrogenase [Actinomycetota bacterium]
MKVLNCYNENDFRIEEMEKPSISDTEMLIEMLYCSLCGSDVIKIFDSALKKPDVYGHEVVGRVAETGRKVDKFRVGDIVIAAHHIPCGVCHFCRHGNHTMCAQFKKTNIVPGGFSQFIKLSEKHISNTTFKLPEGFDLLRALFIEPLACCIRAMDRIDRLPGDIFSVTGAGAIGILFLQLIKLEGLKAVVIDMDAKRLELAEKLGADLIINPSDKILPDRIGIDAAILTVTNLHTVSDAMSYIRPGGSINIFGMAEKISIIPLNFGSVYKNELTVKSTYSATPATLARAYDLITSGKVDVSSLISEPLPLSHFKKGLEMMLGRKIYKAFYRL